MVRVKNALLIHIILLLIIAKQEVNYMEFKSLTTSEEFRDILDESSSGFVVIFKHSTSCAISAMAWSRMQRGWNIPADDVPVYYLDLLKHRELSNEVSETLGVKHESPQVLVLEDGKCVYHASHNEISPALIVEELN